MLIILTAAGVLLGTSQKDEEAHLHNRLYQWIGPSLLVTSNPPPAESGLCCSNESALPVLSGASTDILSSQGGLFSHTDPNRQQPQHAISSPLTSSAFSTGNNSSAATTPQKPIALLSLKLPTRKDRISADSACTDNFPQSNMTATASAAPPIKQKLSLSLPQQLLRPLLRQPLVGPKK